VLGETTCTIKEKKGLKRGGGKGGGGGGYLELVFHPREKKGKAASVLKGKVGRKGKETDLPLEEPTGKRERDLPGKAESSERESI